MMITYKLKINYQDSRVLTSDMEFVTGDVGAYRLEFSFYDNGARVDVSDKLLTVKAKRADGVVLSDSGSISGNTAVYVPKNEIYATGGALALEIALMDSAKNYLTTKVILANVIEGLGEPQDTAENKSSVYVTLLSEIKTRIDAANQLLTSAQQAQEEANERANAATESAAAANASEQNAASSEKAALAAAENAEKSALAAKASAENAKGLPDVTDADEGKILRVVSGAWSAETLVNAEEESY